MKHVELSQREVTEDDFRQPQFRGAKAEEYEFDSTGEVVRKDRFKTAMFHIAEEVGLNIRGGWNCNQVMHAVDEIIGVFRKMCNEGATAQDIINARAELKILGVSDSFWVVEE